MSQLEQKTKKTLARFSMIEEGALVLLCVSGGMDSMAMLDIFSSISSTPNGELNIKLAVCHLNHNLRGAESARDQGFVEKAALDLGLKFYTKTLNEGELKDGGSLQERAREARYAFFVEAATELGATRIALAHNKDDQAETVLMRIIKGSGLKGLSGMPAVREPYIRPLIEVSRAEIEEYVKEHNVGFVEDSSNESTKYLRNQLRLDLIPLLEGDYNPMIKDALSSLSAMAETDYSFIENEARGLFESAKESESEGAVVFSREPLTSAHPALSARVFLMAVNALKGTSKEIYSAHVDSFLNLIQSSEPAASVDLPGGLKLRRDYEQVIIELAELDAEEAGAPGYEVELNVPGVTKLGDTGESFKAKILEETPDPKEASELIAFFDFDVVDEMDGSLVVRTFRAGDRMTPMGMQGKKKVQDIFVDDKVAKLRRASVPILLCAEEVLWLAGVRQSETAKLTPWTKRTLKIEWQKGSVK